MSLQTSMCSNSFWQSVNILINKFNVINRRLWGCKTLFSCIYKNINEDWHTPSTCTRLNAKENIDSYLERILQELDLVQYDSVLNNKGVQIVVIKLLPKLYSQNKAFQLILMEKCRTTVTFYDITPETYNQNLCPEFRYSITLVKNKIILNTSSEQSSKSYQWLVNKVLPQFVKWGEENFNKNTFCNNSLSLVPTEKYYKKYNELKFKYGKEMVEIWPEGTDPSKYVYEDVAIATYLLLLWEDEAGQQEQNRKTFVDLGCGNGLLVYILTKEGHEGVGIDVRKRQIWDMFHDIKLEVKTIIPSDVNLFPEADWLIGNHSDELTPWIPVIAARSSYKCKFFLLPCCAYNFDGTKYQRRDSSKSQYTEYLEYIKEVCQSCGFDTKIDRLKIPSTKRICLVGQTRIYPKEDYQMKSESINVLIGNDSVVPSTETDNTASWASNFKPRDSIEKVRNCTQIDKDIIETIVRCITKYLLEGCNIDKEWSCGKIVDLGDLISLLHQDQLNAMKAECGGLQTLLKNNHHIFKVQCGKVQLRYPKTIEEVNNVKSDKSNKRDIKVKQKPCWFYINHPQGCPLTDTICSYLHIK